MRVFAENRAGTACSYRACFGTWLLALAASTLGLPPGGWVLAGTVFADR